MKNICIISDNRTGKNWGARATSIALDQILREKYNIVGTIYNSYKVKEYIIGFRFANMIFINKSKFDSGNKIFRRIANSIISLGLKLHILKLVDFKSPCIKRNVDVFFKYKKFVSDFIIFDTIIGSCDTVIVNGEGDMIFNKERRTLIFLLNLIEIAVLAKKDVYYINAMISKCPVSGIDKGIMQQSLNALKKCKGIQLRDIESYNLLKELDSSIYATISPDALFSWLKIGLSEYRLSKEMSNIIVPFDREYLFGSYDFSKPYICISGSSIAPKLDKKELISSYIKLIEKIKQFNLPIYLVVPCIGDMFLIEVGKATGLPVVYLETPILLAAKIISESSLFISGRYHPSIMATLGGVPIICFSSNSHKMIGLQKLIGYSNITHYELPLNSSDIDNIYLQAKLLIDNKRIKDNTLKIVADFAQQIQSNLSF